ncbi:MAG: sigma-54 dependent transcriptional regulator [Polyangiaceae bacterium]
MSDEPIHVLVVDDDAAPRRSLARLLLARGFKVEVAENGMEALDSIRARPPEVALVDLQMPNMSGLDVLSEIKRSHVPTEVIIMTAYAEIPVAVEAVKAGAHDFLRKPFESVESIVLAVERAAEYRRLIERASHATNDPAIRTDLGGIVGQSPPMQELYRQIEEVASSSATVLILGESGTGKELVARAIHERSKRSDGPFLAVNCGAIPGELVESELFGHTRGAFTGAQSARPGLFEAAHGGTILLDEVGDLPLSVQVKLLRTLQENEIRRVGSDEVKHVDVRVIAATNVDLDAKVGDGVFRRDLFYRLNVFPITLPALRERRSDIVVLAHHFLRKYSTALDRRVTKLATEAIRALEDYGWPGNVRELEHAVERAVLLARGDTIEAQHLPFVRRQRPVDADARPSDSVDLSRSVLADFPYAEAKKRALQSFDRAYIAELLRRAAGNRAEAARRAGLDRSNFRRLIKKSNDD